MKKMLLLAVGIMALTLSGCTESSTEVTNDVSIPASAKDLKKENYEDVQLQLEKAGFTNIELKPLEDLITGWLTSDGEVEKVSVDGITDFSEKDLFNKDSKVVITYHTFKEESSDTNPESSSISNSTTEIKESISETTTETKESSESKVTDESTEEIITAENNEEFSKVLSVNDDDTLYKAFVDKYKDKTVRFDGNIGLVSKHSNYDTRFDFLISSGNYESDTSQGAFFQIQNASYYDLKLTGDNVPDSITQGLNISITAKVVEYSQGDLIILEPIEIKVR
ncbi:DUF4839 domain-containing protein [Enterococcus casseliflavus]|uniref:DUF4839 domain-containing protein n=1 Tax=Enterococcus casseliflavus TaxID=37734 RepID=UPI0034D1A99F